jgi:hypothetical protein
MCIFAIARQSSRNAPIDARAIANHDTPRGDRGRLFWRIDELGLLVVAFACVATLVWSLIRFAYF